MCEFLAWSTHLLDCFPFAFALCSFQDVAYWKLSCLQYLGRSAQPCRPSGPRRDRGHKVCKPPLGHFVHCYQRFSPSLRCFFQLLSNTKSLTKWKGSWFWAVKAVKWGRNREFLSLCWFPSSSVKLSLHSQIVNSNEFFTNFYRIIRHPFLLRGIWFLLLEFLSDKGSKICQSSYYKTYLPKMLWMNILKS